MCFSKAFGNAKTIRNNNSSRFGRFMQLSVGPEGGIKHGSIRNFLLEKVRVTSQEPNERSYHIFYQLVKGANPSIKSAADLLPIEEYEYLKRQSGGCYDCPGKNHTAKRAIISHKNAFSLLKGSVCAACSCNNMFMLKLHCQSTGTSDAAEFIDVERCFVEMGIESVVSSVWAVLAGTLVTLIGVTGYLTGLHTSRL